MRPVFVAMLLRFFLGGWTSGDANRTRERLGKKFIDFNRLKILVLANGSCDGWRLSDMASRIIFQISLFIENFAKFLVWRIIFECQTPIHKICTCCFDHFASFQFDCLNGWKNLVNFDYMRCVTILLLHMFTQYCNCCSAINATKKSCEIRTTWRTFKTIPSLPFYTWVMWFFLRKLLTSTHIPEMCVIK